MKTIADFIETSRSRLRDIYEPSEIQRLVVLLLEEVKGGNDTSWQLKPSVTLNQTEATRLENYLSQLEQHKPIQYVLGHAWFCGMKFLVDESVLIPRPETEELTMQIVDEKLNLPAGRNGIKIVKPHILDIGTGSGCIAIALKKKWPEATVTAIDISDAALSIAKRNAEWNQVDVEFLKGDILLKQQWTASEKRFDIIVSNPPYIATVEMEAMSPSVKDYEPHLALFVKGEDPLIFYSSIADFAKQRLNSGGKLFFEINQKFGTPIKQMLEEKGFIEVEVKKDLSGNERIIAAGWK